MKVSLQDILNGQILTRNFVRRQYKLVIEIVLLIIGYIYLGYYDQEEHRHLTSLQQELQDAEYEAQTLQSRLTSLTRQSAVAAELEKRSSRLKENHQPPTRIR